MENEQRQQGIRVESDSDDDMTETIAKPTPTRAPPALFDSSSSSDSDTSFDGVSAIRLTSPDNGLADSIDPFLRLGFERRHEESGAAILAKPLSEGIEYYTAVLVLANHVYHGILHDGAVYILNSSRDDVPAFRTSNSVVDCKLAFHGSEGSCFMAAKADVALECTTPTNHNDPVVLHGFYRKKLSTDAYTRTSTAGEATEKLLNEMQATLSAPGAYNLAEVHAVLDTLVIAPTAWYGALELIVINELATEDPLCTMERSAEGAYKLLGKLFDIRATATHSSFPVNNLSFDTFRAIMDTLDKWETGQHLQIVRATHIVMHAMFAFRCGDHTFSGEYLMFGVKMALWNRPLSRLPMTLTEAVVLLHQWAVNSPRISWDNEADMGNLPNWFVTHGDQIVFHPEAQPRKETAALFAKLETYADAVLAALNAGTLKDRRGTYVQGTRQLRPITTQQASEGTFVRASDQVTLYVEGPPAIARMLTASCRHSTAIVRPLLTNRARSSSILHFAVLDPGDDPRRLARTCTDYVSYLDARTVGVWPLTSTLPGVGSFGGEIILLELSHTDPARNVGAGGRVSALKGVHLSFFFYQTDAAAKRSFMARCAVERKELAPRLLAAIRDVAFVDMDALVVSLQDEFHGRVYFDKLTDAFQAVESSTLSNAAGRVAAELAGGPKTTPRGKAIYDRHGAIPTPVKGLQTPVSVAKSVEAHGYYGRVGFITKGEFTQYGGNEGILPKSTTHVCPRPARFLVQHADSTMVVRVPWSFSTRNAFDFICDHLGVSPTTADEQPAAMIEMNTPPYKELTRQRAHHFLYTWHDITLDAIPIVVKLRPNLKRPASRSPVQPPSLGRPKFTSPAAYDSPTQLFAAPEVARSAGLRSSSYSPYSPVSPGYDPQQSIGVQTESMLAAFADLCA